jgi:diaminopimelate decarboxylase
VSAPLELRLLPDTAEVHDNDIVVGGVSLRELAVQFGTPLFVYDEATLRSQAREAATGFDPGVAFASKSFFCGAMAALAVEEGLCVDVSTAGELDVALRAGVPSESIIVHGNNKSTSELQQALEVGVRRIIVDSFDEIGRLVHLVSAATPARCMVRVTPGVEAHTHEFVRTGHEDTKFGFSLASGDAQRALDELREIPHISVEGVHCHIGSQIFALDSYREAVRLLAEFLRTNAVSELCIGGGLGVAYVAEEVAPTVGEWAAAVREALAEHGLDDVHLTAEPGRSIVARAGLTIYEVGTRKVAAQRTYLAVDGGMSDNPRPVLYGSGYEAVALRAPRAERTTPYRIVGKHCESGDFLIDEAWLPGDVQPGDLIATPVTGAYGYSMASNYNRVPRPAVVFVCDGTARLVLRRETLDDLSRLEV